jgi:hypothetical protein
MVPKRYPIIQQKIVLTAKKYEMAGFRPTQKMGFP